MNQSQKNNLPRITTLLLFPKINKELISLLKSLSLAKWCKSTVLPGRTVKDLASHLLDGSLRRLSACRDNYQINGPKIDSYQKLVKHVQELNKNWIEATQRLNPTILISLLELSEKWLYAHFKSLDLNAPAKFSVAWAGELKSKNWFDIAREYTEKWHHQMQIRLAVNQPGINSRKLFYPVIDTFMRGLPQAYKDIKTKANSGIEICITGNGGGVVVFGNNGWTMAVS